MRWCDGQVGVGEHSRRGLQRVRSAVAATCDQGIHELLREGDDVMACLEIECAFCGKIMMANSYQYRPPCARCGSLNWEVVTYDEANDHDDVADWRNDE